MKEVTGIIVTFESITIFPILIPSLKKFYFNGNVNGNFEMSMTSVILQVLKIFEPNNKVKRYYIYIYNLAYLIIFNNVLL